MFRVAQVAGKCRISVPIGATLKPARRMSAYRRDTQSDDWIGKAVADVLDLDASDQADLKQIKTILKTWFANGVLATEDRKDGSAGYGSSSCPGLGTTPGRTARRVLHLDFPGGAKVEQSGAASSRADASTACSTPPQ